MVLNYIGKISYCCYLVHVYVPDINSKAVEFINNSLPHHAYAAQILASYPSIYCIDLLILAMITWISYSAIEQPILRLKKSFNYSQK